MCKCWNNGNVIPGVLLQVDLVKRVSEIYLRLLQSLVCRFAWDVKISKMFWITRRGVCNACIVNGCSPCWESWCRFCRWRNAMYLYHWHQSVNIRQSPVVSRARVPPLNPCRLLCHYSGPPSPDPCIVLTEIGVYYDQLYDVWHQLHGIFLRISSILPL